MPTDRRPNYFSGLSASARLFYELPPGSSNPIQGTDYLAGVLWPGRRPLNVKLMRHADGWHRDIQDGRGDLESTGRSRVLCLTSSDILDPFGVSANALDGVTTMIERFPKSLIELITIHPRVEKFFEWDDVPGVVKQHARCASTTGITRRTSKAALAVIRPDGYVVVVAELGDVARRRELLAAVCPHRLKWRRMSI
ncbi:hypothetical protein GB937_001790 [Aspergillus fischeri]|nr:hypothetical protein GB937_001790 [Aspergillus fischeri]